MERNGKFWILISFSILLVLIVTSILIALKLISSENDLVKSDPELKVTQNTYSYEDIWINFSSVSAFNNFSEKYSDDDYSDNLQKEIIGRLKDKAEKEGEDPEELETCLEMAISRYDQDYKCLPCYCEKANFRYYKSLSGLDSTSRISRYNESHEMEIGSCWIIVINDRDNFNHIKIYVMSISDNLIRDYHVCD